MSKVKELLEFLEYEAHSLTATEFCGMLDGKDIPWVCELLNHFSLHNLKLIVQFPHL